MPIESVMPSCVVPFLTRHQPFPESGSFQKSQFFSSGGQSIGVSATASDLPMKTQDWTPLRWTHWVSLLPRGLSKSLLQQNSSKTSLLQHSAYFMVQLSQPYMNTGKTINLTRQTVVGKIMSMFLNMLSRLVIAVLYICFVNKFICTLFFRFHL